MFLRSWLLFPFFRHRVDVPSSFPCSVCGDSSGCLANRLLHSPQLRRVVLPPLHHPPQLPHREAASLNAIDPFSPPLPPPPPSVLRRPPRSLPPARRLLHAPLFPSLFPVSTFPLFHTQFIPSQPASVCLPSALRLGAHCLRVPHSHPSLHRRHLHQFALRGVRVSVQPFFVFFDGECER